MVRVDRALAGMQARMLLQVHDELVLEAPPEEVDAVKKMVCAEMQGVAQLLVPLVAEWEWAIRGGTRSRRIALSGRYAMSL